MQPKHDLLQVIDVLSLDHIILILSLVLIKSCWHCPESWSSYADIVPSLAQVMQTMSEFKIKSYVYYMGVQLGKINVKRNTSKYDVFSYKMYEGD